MHRSAFTLAAAGSSALLLSIAPALGAPTVPSRVASSVAPAATAVRPVTRAQLSNQLDSSFQMFDTNGDKALSKAEIEAAQARSVAQAQANAIKRTETEFARMDSNQDGQLSLAEFKAGAPAPRVADADQMLQKLDTNKDGKIGQDEYRAAPLANFDRLDTDKDGSISPQEKRAAAPRTP